MGRRNKGRGSNKKKRGGKSKQQSHEHNNNNNEEGASDTIVPQAFEEELPDELRFNVGDRVDCHMGDDTWASGTIIMTNWENDMGDIFPYRIRLDNGMITYAPVDMDDCIKRSSTHAVDVNVFKVGSRVECLRNGIWSIGTVTNRHQSWLEDDPVGSAPYYIRFDSQPGISAFFLGPASGIKSSKAEQMMDAELRFGVGDRVECSVGDDRQNVRKWLPGTIIKTHYKEPTFGDGFVAPYQIRLDIGRLIYAPADEDSTIRKIDSPAPACWICYDDEQTEHNKIVRECACRGEENGYVHLGCLAKLAIAKAGNKYQEGIDDENPFNRCITCKQEFRTDSESFSALAKRCMGEYGDKMGNPWYGTATSMIIRLMIMESRSYEEDSGRYDFAEKMLLNRCDAIIQCINLGGPNTPHLMLDLSRLYDVLAIVHEEKGELDKMKETLDRSLRLIVSLENGTPSRRKIKILSSLAKHACLVGDTIVAVKHYEKCISIMRGQAKENDILLATLLLKSGNLELELGNTERGIEQISESVDTMTTVYGCDDELVSKLGSSFDKICEGDLRSIPKALLVRVDFPRAPLYSSRSF